MSKYPTKTTKLTTKLTTHTSTTPPETPTTETKTTTTTTETKTTKRTTAICPICTQTIPEELSQERLLACAAYLAPNLVYVGPHCQACHAKIEDCNVKKIKEDIMRGWRC